MKPLSFCILLFVSLTLSVSATLEWPAWRGPDGTGVGSAKDLPVEWSTDSNIAWKLALPAWSGSSPIISGDSIYFISPSKEEVKEQPKEPAPTGRDTLNALPALKAILLQFDAETIQVLVDRLGDFSALQSLLEGAINDELPSKLEEGGYIKDGYDAELDRMRDLMRNNKTWISDLEAREKEVCGIRNLKIKYNNAFGL